jgi:hypothetical protein
MVLILIKVFSFFYSEVKQSRGVQPMGVGLLDIGSCNLHIVHNAFENGMKQLSHLSIDCLLRNVYSWMKSSAGRKSDFLEVQKEYSQDGKLPLYYAKWLWLSVIPSIARTIQLDPVLQNPFFDN